MQRRIKIYCVDCAYETYSEDDAKTHRTNTNPCHVTTLTIQLILKELPYLLPEVADL